MSKYQSSGLIQGVRGSMGDSTFYYWKGIPVVKKRMRRENYTNTPSQGKIRRIFSELSSQWRKLSFRDWTLLEQYAKRYTKMKGKKRNGLVWAIGGKMSGFNAFISVNQLLMLCGFEPIQKPVLGNIGKPPLARTDLIDFGVYEKEINFNV